MKKFLMLSAASLMVFAACEKDPGTVEYPEPEKGASYLLEGTVEAAGFTWNSQSVVGLYSSTEGVKATNLECKIVGWEAPVVEEEGTEEGGETPAPQATMTKASQYEGKAVAQFNTPAMDLVKGENQFFVYTPYNPELVYVRGLIYGLDISDAQVQPAPNVAGACFACGTAKGIAGVDEAFKFTLTPITAMAKITIGSSEFVGYSVKKITVMDIAKEAKLGGGFNVNVADMSFQIAEAFSRVSVNVTAPAPLEAGKTQDFYIQLLPGDYTSSELVIMVEMEKDGSVVTLPIKKSGLKFEGGKTTEISFTSLGVADNMAKDWYVPVETRKLAGARFAYGEANTYFIQCKNGQTYNGATYTPNADIPDEVTIDIRPRGDFFSVVDPKGATFEWALKGDGKPYGLRTAGYEASKVVPTAYEFTYDGNYTVKVKNTGAFAGAPILLMKKDGKVLWAWTFWNIAADGTKITEIAVGDDKIANIDLGQSTDQYATWVANKNGTNPDVVYRTTYLYQYGRPMPIFWDNYWTMGWDGAAGNIPALAGPLPMLDAISKPVGLILHPTNNTNLGSWSEETYADLWGGSKTGDNTEKGAKTIYDPCPKGWRVAYPGIFDALLAGGKTYENGVGYPGVRFAAANDNLFVVAGYGNGKTADNGRLATMGGHINGTAAGSKYGLLWTNMCGASQGTAMLFHSSGASGSANRLGTFNKTVNAAVRCMRDTENR